MVTSGMWLILQGGANGRFWNVGYITGWGQRSLLECGLYYRVGPTVASGMWVILH